VVFHVDAENAEDGLAVHAFQGEPMRLELYKEID